MDEPKYWERSVNRSLCRFFLLRALSQKPRHGYEIGKFISETCSGCCRPTAAMIYPTLHELLEGGYIECHTELNGGRERKVYSLTEKGTGSYRMAVDAWQKAIPHLMEAAEASGERGTNGRKEC